MSDNIIKSLETDDYISFKIECACFDHDMQITVEQDEEYKDNILLTINDKVYIDEIYSDKNIFYRLWMRIKIALNVIFKGYHEIDYEFEFKNTEHFNDFVEYLNKCKNKFIK